MNRLFTALATTGVAVGLCATPAKAQQKIVTQEYLDDAIGTQNAIQAKCEPVSQYVVYGVQGQSLGQNLGPCMVEVANQLKDEWTKADDMLTRGSDLYKATPYYFGVATALKGQQCDSRHENLKTVAGNLDGSSDGILRFTTAFGDYVDACTDLLHDIKKLADQNDVKTTLNEGSIDLIRLFSYGARGATVELGFENAATYAEAFKGYVSAQASGQAPEVQVIPNRNTQQLSPFNGLR